jgi:ribosomal protein S18 acetylase RimI-like enzyme
VKKIFHASLPVLQEAGYAQYLLEVLQDNEAAVALYKGLGFSVTRDFNYFNQSMDNLQLYDKPMPVYYRLEETDIAHADEMTAMWDFNPSWQNSFDCINRALQDFKIIGVFKNNLLAGYGILETSSGDIAQIAVHKDHRRQGIATQILHALLKHNKSHVVKVINTASTCTSITTFFEKNGIAKKAMQYEMVREIC